MLIGLDSQRSGAAATQRTAHPAGADAGAAEAYRAARIAHWDQVARSSDRRRTGGAYHRRLEQVYRQLVRPGLRVLELGCGRGDLLAAVEPAGGVGVDFSPEMVERARRDHPALEFIVADGHAPPDLDGRFDAIVLSDLLHDLWDVQGLLAGLHRFCHRNTRVLMNFYSRLWELPLAAATALGLAASVLRQNWLSARDVSNLLRLSGFREVRSWPEILLPLPLPALAPFCNRFLLRFWPVGHLALANFMVARPRWRDREVESPRVSVVIPARNEAGNIAPLFERVPEMGAGTELIFVEGHSSDGTYETIAREMSARPQRPAKLLRQTGRGKGDAVRLGFAAASGDVLMILDADITVPPEALPRFLEVMIRGEGEFVNGVRLVYPMGERAMRFANLVGNKFFSMAFTWLLGQPIKDTLCGTKVLRREAYDAIAANRSYFGEFDPFGDFDLLFGAARLNLEIVDLPIRYRERTYGTTNIQRWRHGWLLLKMCAFAASRLKFV